MVIGKITSYLALGLVGAFLLNALIRPGSAIATGGALQETGSGIASIGAGIGSSLSALGTGGADLFKPLWELKNLVYYTSDVAGSASVGPVSQEQGETNNGKLTPSSSTITWSSGTTATVPSLSPAAKSYYSKLGVGVS
jgi:hypothetical protein|tara:strand:- start:925 stop:1341 length:417 start_codon:yes stop_codon:yes gene_type:complete